MMRLPPMFTSLSRHKLIVLLLIATTAMSSAVVTNVAAMIVHRLSLLNEPSGLQEPAVVTLDSTNIQNDTIKNSSSNHLEQYRADVATLRRIVGVDAAAFISGLPYAGGDSIDIGRGPNDESNAQFQVAAYNGSSGIVKALGLNLIQGRDFLESEYLPSSNTDNLSKVSVAIVSRALANRLFHSKQAVGRLFYSSNHAIQVVGVADHLMGTNPQLGGIDNESAILLPLEPDGDNVTFTLSVPTQDHDRVLERAKAALAERDPTRVLDNAQSFVQLKAEYFQRERSMINLLMAAGLALLVVTAAGIMGLVSFWVQQRTHSIGIRRALGATRADILRYFLIENFMIVTGGVLAGGALACVLNSLMVENFPTEVLPAGYLVVGALALWFIGLVAGLSPTMRAAAVDPAVATRSI